MKAPPWFLAPRSGWRHGEIALPPEESRHAARVLRMTEHDVIAVTDGRGCVARCEVSSVKADAVTAHILEVTEHPPARLRLAVYQGAAKGQKLDGVVQQLTELGIAELHVFHSSRSVTRWDEGKAERLRARWQAVAAAAAKQARNPWVPEIGGVMDFEELAAALTGSSSAIVLWEEATVPLRSALKDPPADRIAVVAGPEGGLAPLEAETLAGAGARCVTLGPRILRTEHAAVAAVTMLSFHYGLLG